MLLPPTLYTDASAPGKISRTLKATIAVRVALVSIVVDISQISSTSAGKENKNAGSYRVLLRSLMHHDLMITWSQDGKLRRTSVT